ncbi:mucin-associated surface protein (MASP), putative [Trypanosoma cruzi]|nr:mucin-associated surface protein (MASP), putative [Trypanosoma cruzi]
MAMITGRVLLVCALCVLWCGACCGGRAEASPASPDTATDEQPQNKEAAGVAGEEVQSAQQEAQKEPAPTASVLPAGVPNSPQPQQPEGGGSVAGQPAAAAAPTPRGSDTEEQVGELEVVVTNDGKIAGDAKEQRDVNAADSQHQRGDQSSSSSSSSGSSGTEGVKQPVVKENSKSNETSDKPSQEEEEEEEEEEQEEHCSNPDSREPEAEEQETEEALEKRKYSVTNGDTWRSNQ